MPPLIRALRPLQWVKNLLIFAALIFAERYTLIGPVSRAVAAFGCFCAIASAGYLFNDLRDLAADRKHPEKKHRPLASGAVNPETARAVAATLLSLGLVGAWFINAGFFACAASYLALTFSYSAWLKRFPVVDVFVIASGFVLRAAAGAVAITVPISPWLLVCTGFLALYIAIGKRRAEILLLEEDAVEHRANLAAYRPETLNQFSSVMGATTIMTYAMYTFEGSPTHWLMITIPMVVAGILRYEMLGLDGDGGSPEKMLLKDPAFTGIGIAWIAAVVLVLLLAPR